MKEVKKRGRAVSDKKSVKEEICQCKKLDNLSKRVKSLEKDFSEFMTITSGRFDTQRERLDVLSNAAQSASKESGESKIFCRTVREWMVKKGWLNPLE